MICQAAEFTVLCYLCNSLPAIRAETYFSDGTVLQLLAVVSLPALRCSNVQCELVNYATYNLHHEWFQ